MERRRLAGEIHALVSRGLERRGFVAAFTERTGGASPSPFSSLNLGLHTGDDPRIVERNRSSLTAALGVQGLVTARQVHGAHILRVERREGSPAGNPLRPGRADALRTSSAGLALAVMTADCVPLVLASEQEGDLSVVHVGWRGLARGIVQGAVHAYAEPGRLAAAIGPAIGPCHYEVGEEVIDAVQRGTDGAFLSRDGGTRPRLDLPGTVEALLRGAGVRDVERAEECTACEAARFFSHRRDGRTGRQALVAVRV